MLSDREQSFDAELRDFAALATDRRASRSKTAQPHGAGRAPPLSRKLCIVAPARANAAGSHRTGRDGAKS